MGRVMAPALEPGRGLGSAIDWERGSTAAWAPASGLGLAGESATASACEWGGVSAAVWAHGLEQGSVASMGRLCEGPKARVWPNDCGSASSQSEAVKGSARASGRASAGGWG